MSKIKVKRPKITNIAGTLSEAQRKEIAVAVVEGYEDDLSSSSAYFKEVAKWRKLFFGRKDKKTTPWVGAANISLPETSIACIQSHARHYQALMASERIAKGKPVGLNINDFFIANRMERYLNYQLNVKINEFKRKFSKSLMMMAIDGTVIRKVFYNPRLDSFDATYLAPDDFVINYYTREIEDAPRMTQVIRMPLRDVKLKQKSGEYLKSEIEEGDDNEIGPVRDEMDKNNKITKTRKDKTEPLTILEQYKSLDLNDDGNEVDYIITVNRQSEELLSLVERTNPKNGKPLIYFVKYEFLPNPDGFYGIGYGKLLLDLNETMNTLVNQLIDAGTLSNHRGGFVSKRSGLRRGSLKFKMGEYKEVDLRVDDIKKAIMDMTFNPPSQTSFSLLGMLKDYAARVTTVTELVTGKMPSSDTPASTVLSLLEQATQVFTSIHKHTHTSFQKELKLLATLIDLHMPELLEEYYSIVINDEGVTEEDKKLIKQEIKNDFSSSVDVIPVSDPNIISKVERVSKANQVYQAMLNDPYTRMNPEAVLNSLRDLFIELEVPEHKIRNYIDSTLELNNFKQQIQQTMQQVIQLIQQNDQTGGQLTEAVVNLITPLLGEQTDG